MNIVEQLATKVPDISPQEKGKTTRKPEGELILELHLYKSRNETVLFRMLPHSEVVGWVEGNNPKMDFATGDRCTFPGSNHECHISNHKFGQLRKKV